MVEMIVVMAIIAVLAGILVPSLAGYVNKARRSADAATGKQIYNDIMTVLYTDDSKYMNTYGSAKNTEQTPYQSFNNVGSKAHGTGITTNAGNTYNFGYDIEVIAVTDGNSSGKKNKPTWTSNDAVAFCTALNDLHNLSSTTSAQSTQVKIQSKKDLRGQHVDRWFIVRKKNEPDVVEVWIGTGLAPSEFGPMYRLYPECDSKWITGKSSE